MKVSNPHYYYGKRIIWNAYKEILVKERDECRKRQEMIVSLGEQLLGGREDPFKAMRIVEVFNSLEKEQRKLLYLRYCYGLSVKEIANVYGVSGAAISHRMTKYRKKFCELWEGGDADD